MKRFLFVLVLGLSVFLPEANARRRWSPKIAPATTFNPQTQGTLVNWYDASTLGLINGANINPWPDSKTGNPNPMTAAVTPPTYATNQQNLLGTATFGGSAERLEGGGSTASTYPYTFAVVVKVSSIASPRTIMGPSAIGGLQFRVTTSGAIEFLKAQIASIGASTGTIATGAYHVIIGTVDSSSYSFTIDGVAAGSGSHSQTLTGGTTLRMGVSIISELWAGSIGEIQVYSSVLSGSDQTGCTNYLKGKWGIP